METASKFVTNIDVAERVKKATGSSESGQALLSKVSAEPIAQSNVVAVTATADSPQLAQELANAFAKQAVADRTKRLHERVNATAPLLRQQIPRTPRRPREPDPWAPSLRCCRPSATAPTRRSRSTRSPTSPAARSRRGRP